MAEISQLANALKEYAEASQRWIILMLHSTLSVKEQNKVFDISPTGVRKVILSTNIAEASVTIDEIRFVIDSGRANVNYYDPKLRVTKLVDQYISKASADQRKGLSCSFKKVKFDYLQEEPEELVQEFVFDFIPKISTIKCRISLLQKFNELI